LKVFVQLGLLPLVGISWLALKFGPVPTTTLMIVFMLGLIRLVSKGISPVSGRTLPNGTKKTIDLKNHHFKKNGLTKTL